MWNSGSIPDHDLDHESGLEFDVVKLHLIMQQSTAKVPPLIEGIKAMSRGQAVLGMQDGFFGIDGHLDIVVKGRDSELDEDLLTGWPLLDHPTGTTGSRSRAIGFRFRGRGVRGGVVRTVLTIGNQVDGSRDTVCGQLVPVTQFVIRIQQGSGWEGDAGTVNDCLSQVIVPGLGCICGRL